MSHTFARPYSAIAPHSVNTNSAVFSCSQHTTPSTEPRAPDYTLIQATYATHQADARVELVAGEAGVAKWFVFVSGVFSVLRFPLSVEAVLRSVIRKHKGITVLYYTS